MKRPLWIALGMLALLTLCICFWLVGHERAVRQVEDDSNNSHLFPYAGTIQIRISNMEDTTPTSAPIHTVLGDVTNSTPVEFEVISQCDAFIDSFSEAAEFLDSWGKVIAKCHFVISDIKPHERKIGREVVMNLPREKLHGWRLRPSTGEGPKRSSRYVVNIQRVEGSNTLAEVTAEVQ